MAQLFTYVKNYVDCIVSTAGDVITFITAEGHEIVLIGAVGALVFGILGAARSFIKGV